MCSLLFTSPWLREHMFTYKTCCRYYEKASRDYSAPHSWNCADVRPTIDYRKSYHKRPGVYIFRPALEPASIRNRRQLKYTKIKYCAISLASPPYPWPLLNTGVYWRLAFITGFTVYVMVSIYIYLFPTGMHSIPSTSIMIYTHVTLRSCLINKE